MPVRSGHSHSNHVDVVRRQPQLPQRIERYGQDWQSAADAAEQMVDHLEHPREFYDTASRLAIPGQPAAEAAVDMGLRDLVGKRLEIPLYELLGLDPSATPPTSTTRPG